jgi:hypothetical protein
MAGESAHAPAPHQIDPIETPQMSGMIARPVLSLEQHSNTPHLTSSLEPRQRSRIEAGERSQEREGTGRGRRRG